MSIRKRLSQRNASNWRQSEDVIIQSQTNGTWDVKVEGRTYGYTGVGGTWLDADNQPGELARLAFVQGNPLLPIFFSRGSRPNAAFVSAGFAPIALTANWRCQHGDFQRRNSYTGATFNFAALEAKPSLSSFTDYSSSGAMPRFYEGFAAWVSADYVVMNRGDQGYDEGIGGGDPYQLGPWLYQQIPSDPGLTYAINLATDLPEGLVTDWLTFSMASLAILDDGEIVLWWSHTFMEDTDDFVTIFANDGTGQRKTAFPETRLRAGADTVACGDYLCTPTYDEFTFEEFVHIWQISGTTLTSTELELTGADSTGSIGVVWPEAEPTLPESWVGSDRFIVQSGGGLYGIDPSVPGIDWTYTGTKPLRPLAVNNNSTLICAYENYAKTTVTDVYDSGTWDGVGGVTEDREILAEGLSTTAGLLYLSCTTGNEIAAFAFDGEEDFGSQNGAKLESRTTHEGYSYTSPAWFTSETWGHASGWSSALVYMRDAVLVGGTEPEEPGEFEAYPYATATWANDLYEAINHYGLPPVSGSGPGEAWIDEAWALFLEEREHLVRQAFEILAARPGPSHYIKRELWRNTWPSVSTTFEAYDLHTVFGGATYTSPPTVPSGGVGFPDPANRGIPSSYEGTEEAGEIADTEEPITQGDYTGGSYWFHGPGQKTYSWELVKVWSNVQEEIPVSRTPTPIHATGPAAIGLGLIVIGPPAATGINNDAHWVARPINNPTTPTWTFSVPAEPDEEVLTGNTWIDGGRVWIEYNTGAGWVLVGLLPDTGLPDEADPEILLDSAPVVFDGVNLHGENCEWAIGPA